MAHGTDNATRLSFALKKTAPKPMRDLALREITKAFVESAGNVSAAAIALDVSRVALHRWITEYPALRKALAGARGKQR